MIISAICEIISSAFFSSSVSETAEPSPLGGHAGVGMKIIIFPVVYIGWTIACFAHILMENRENLEHIAKHLNNNELFCDKDYLERS